MPVASVNAYRANQVSTISRGQLLLLAYDGIARFLQEGRAAMLERRHEAQNAHLQKAQDLLVELLCALNPDAFPELAQNLEQLYTYMY
ncbi:MAG TPA: flagellar export chaperone FliS, partial [Armatimonadota bacterium]|nr:flagellar export chaperone FliS [Armatimonadota bacterium]